MEDYIKMYGELKSLIEEKANLEIQDKNLESLKDFHYKGVISLDLKSILNLGEDWVLGIFPHGLTRLVKASNLAYTYGASNKQIEVFLGLGGREDIFPVFKLALKFSSYIDIFNKALESNNLGPVNIGIGFVVSERLELKYIERDKELVDKEILSLDDIRTKARRFSFLGDVGGEGRLNISYGVYENILRPLIDIEGNRVRSEFKEKFNINQGTYFSTNLRDIKMDKFIKSI